MQNSRLLDTLNGNITAIPPVWLMRQAGRYLPEYQALRAKFPDFMSMCRNAEATTALAMQPLERFQLDAAIVFSDILTIADSLDMGVSFVPGQGPVLANPITDFKRIDKLPFAGACDQLDYVYNAVKSLRSRLGKTLPIIGFAGSPWTQSCYMLCGKSEPLFQSAKTFAYCHQDAMDYLLCQLAQVTAEYLYRQHQAGADVLFVIDSWGGTLSDQAFHRLSARPLHIICQALFDKGCRAPVLFYSKGLSHARLAPIASCPNLRGIGLDWTANLPQLQSNFPDLVFQGNLDPAILHAGVEATQQQTKLMLESCNRIYPYIPSLGHGILPKTPIDAVEAFLKTVRSH